MNNLRFNGGTFNGARVVSALALVACTATASINAEAALLHSGSGIVTCSAAVAANPHLDLYGNASMLVGAAYLQAIPLHKHSAVSAVLGTADFIGYSLRYSAGSAEFLGFADLVVIPASSFGLSNILATAGISGTATKTQPGKADVVGTAQTSSSQELITRGASAVVLGTATLYTETRINGYQEAYWVPTALSTISIQESGVVLKQVGALITGQAFLDIEPTLQHRCHASFDVSSEFEPEGYVRVDVQGHAIAGASLIGVAEYTHRVSSHIQGNSTLTNTGIIQQHAVRSDSLIGTASLTGLALKTHAAFSNNKDINAYFTAEAEYWFCGIGQITGTSTLVANSIVYQSGEIGIAGYVDITAEPIIPIPLPAFGRLGGSVELTGSLVYVFCGYAEFLGIGGLSPIGYENLMAPVADSRAFIRPQTIREFKRAYTPAFRRI